MKNKILILGKGFIGTRLKEGFGAEISDRRIYSFKDAQDEINKFSPKIIINCIGQIGRNVDDCEGDLDKTLMSNSFVPVILAEAALRNNLRLIHISTGCIYHFDNTKDRPIEEEKTPDFYELFYSRSKIYAEQALGVLSRKYPFLIVRIRVPLDDRPHPKNILTKIINYKKIIDLPNSVTYIPDFILALKYLIKVKASGIYNVVNKGTLTYPELLEVYKRYSPGFKYQVASFKELNLVRTNLALSTRKLERAGFKIRGISEVLEECVQRYLKYS